MEQDTIQLKLDMTEVKKDISYIKQGHEEMKASINNGFRDVVERIDCLDAKFSAKWVETLLVWIARILGSLILVGGASLMIKVFIDYATK